MRQFGKVDIPQKAFVPTLEMGSDWTLASPLRSTRHERNRSECTRHDSIYGRRNSSPILSPSRLSKAWKDKVRARMQDQFVLDPIQYFDFHLNSAVECARLSQRILEGIYRPSPSERILVEKSKGLCRQLVIPQVVDAIVLQCLSDALYAVVSAKAPTSKSFFEPEDHSFSPGEHEYGQFHAWLNFQESIFNFSKTHRYFVVTDIANYYDSISYNHLRNIISGVTGAPEHLLDLLIYVLSALLWQPDYMPRVEIGLPQINLDAPRLLAHCFLYELDDFLENSSTPDFARYMDDIDVGVDSIPDAKCVLRDIDLVLQTRQVRLNSGKTLILNQEEAIEHFRILDNAYLDGLQAQIDDRLKRRLSLESQRRTVVRRVSSGLRRKRFEGGNGEKILKRLITLGRRCRADLALADAAFVLRMWPGTRENIYDYLASRSLTTASARMLRDFIASEIIVDESSTVLLVNSLTHTAAPRRVGPEIYIKGIADQLLETSFFGLYSKIWLLSKYGSRREIFDLVNRTRRVWSGSYRLGRLIGGLRPLFAGSPMYEDLTRAIVLSRNAGTRETWGFHMQVATDPAVFSEMVPALSSPNPSKSTGITHAKFLLLLSALQNANVPRARKDALVAANKTVWSDYFYRRWARDTAGLNRFP
jgi:hypothetical protein